MKKSLLKVLIKECISQILVEEDNTSRNSVKLISVKEVKEINNKIAKLGAVLLKDLSFRTNYHYSLMFNMGVEGKVPHLSPSTLIIIFPTDDERGRYYNGWYGLYKYDSQRRKPSLNNFHTEKRFNANDIEDLMNNIINIVNQTKNYLKSQGVKIFPCSELEKHHALRSFSK